MTHSKPNTGSAGLQRTVQPMDFVVSRFSRLFPSFWVAIILTFAVTHLHWGSIGYQIVAETLLTYLHQSAVR